MKGKAILLLTGCCLISFGVLAAPPSVGNKVVLSHDNQKQIAAKAKEVSKVEKAKSTTENKAEEDEFYDLKGKSSAKQERFSADEEENTQKKKKVKKPELPKDKVATLERSLAMLTENIDNPAPIHYWFDRISLRGLLNADLNYQTKPEFTKSRSTQIMLSTVKLNIDAIANSWITAHVGIFYATDPAKYYLAANSTGVDLEEGYITVANLAKLPFYFRVGKQYVSFGLYHRYPILRPLTQILSETQVTAAQIGFVDISGLYGTIYVFNGVAQMNHTDRDRLNNSGFMLGYENLNNPLGVNIGFGYLTNMSDVGAIKNDLLNNYYDDRTHGLSAHLNLIAGPFDFALRYVSALQRFATRDFAYRHTSGVRRGAKPRASTIKAGYAFKTKGHDSKFILSYQWTREAYNMSNTATITSKLPINRMSIAYGINLLKNFLLSAELDRDHDYPAKRGGTNKYNNIATIRMTVLI